MSRLFAAVGTLEKFEEASKHLQDQPFGIRLDPNVPPKELHIQDIHGHTFIKLNLK